MEVHMQKYARINPEGRVTGFWSTDVNPVETIPAEAFPISEETWERWIADQEGLRWKAGELVEHVPTTEEKRNLERIQVNKELRIEHDRDVETLSDLVDALMAKGVLDLNDLPVNTQKALARRKALRAKLKTLQ